MIFSPHPLWTRPDGTSVSHVDPTKWFQDQLVFDGVVRNNLAVLFLALEDSQGASAKISFNVWSQPMVGCQSVALAKAWGLPTR